MDTYRIREKICRSSFDLSKRFSLYYSKNNLEKNKSYINNAIFLHNYSAFSLTILEYVDINNLSLEEARKLILEREQHFIDSLKPEYNINPIAGSRLGSNHTEESKTLMSEAKAGENNPMLGKTGDNHPMYGKTHTEDTKALMSIANLGKTLSAGTKALISEALSGENNPMFGKSHSEESKALMSETLKGRTFSAETLAKMSKAKKGKTFSTETVIKMSLARGGGIINVYDPQGSLVNSFSSLRKAALHFDVSYMTISRYVKSGKLFQDKWILSTSLTSNKEE